MAAISVNPFARKELNRATGTWQRPRGRRKKKNRVTAGDNDVILNKDIYQNFDKQLKNTL